MEVGSIPVIEKTFDTYIDKLSDTELSKLGEEFRNSKPFNHIVIDNFLSEKDANEIAENFPGFNEEFWYSYDNPLEIKKATNNWNHFETRAYQFFSHVLSDGFTKKLETILGFDKSGKKLNPDIGLHGGGYHCHKDGGKLNPHLDYSIHPKTGLQRKINLILYINPKWKSEYGGALGLWEHDNETNRPGKLINKVDCLFNRVIIFDTTQKSWHGMCSEVNTKSGLTRNSLAVYYMTEPADDADKHMKVKYAPTEDQKGDESIEELIKQRQSITTFKNTYKRK